MGNWNTGGGSAGDFDDSFNEAMGYDSTDDADSRDSGTDDEARTAGVPTGPVVDTTRTEGAMRDLGMSPFSTPASARDMTLQRSSGGEDLGTVYANSFLDRALDRFDPLENYVYGRGDLPPSILGIESPVRSEVSRVAGLARSEYSDLVDGEKPFDFTSIPYFGGAAKISNVLSNAFTGSYADTAREIAKGATPIIDANGRVIGAEADRGIFTTPETNQFFNLDPAVQAAYRRFNQAQEAERARFGDDGSDQPLIIREEVAAIDERGEPTAFPEFTPRTYNYQPFTSKFYTIPSRFTQPNGLLG